MPPVAPVDHSADLQADAGMGDACASESLAHGNPGNMAQPSSTPSSRLETLPNELKVAIFEQLVCDKNHWTSRARPDSRDNLRNLCLVSKRIDLINLSTLEMTFMSTHDRALMLFRRTFPSEPLTRIRHPDYTALFGRVRNATWSTAVGVATQFLPRLETLTLRSTSRQGGHANLGVEMFQYLLDLPSLRTVRSISDDGNWCVFAPDAELYEPLQHPQEAWPTRRNITTLHLSESSACQYDMEDIAQLFPCLEVLSVGRRLRGSAPGRARNYVGRGSRRDLSTTFGRLTALRSLEIKIYPDPAITSNLYNLVTASLGPGNVLSLAQLPNLQRLGVPSYVFAHMSRPALGGTIAIPRDVLPQSLKTLVLLTQRDCGWPGLHVEEQCWDSLATALKFLESLGNDLPYLPHLESVAYCSMEYSCGHPLASAVSGGQDNEKPENSTTSRLQAVRASFSKQNVQFLLQEGDMTNSRPIEL